MENLDFGQALNALKNGEKVSCKSWHGKGMFLQLQRPDENSKMTMPYIFINIPKDHVSTPGGSAYDRAPWVASQYDLMSNDWFIA